MLRLCVFLCLLCCGPSDLNLDLIRGLNLQIENQVEAVCGHVFSLCLTGSVTTHFQNKSASYKQLNTVKVITFVCL